MTTEQQDHPLMDKTTMTIYRDGLHRYWTSGDTTKSPSVTGLIAHVGGDNFSVGKGWAIKQIKLHKNEDGGYNPDIPNVIGKAAREEGDQLHKDIHNYVEVGVIAEENNAFLAWYKALGSKNIFPASELFIYNDKLKYGGTIDQVVINNDKLIVLDTKSVDAESWIKYGSSLRRAKDWAQVAAYTMALNAMNSVHKTFNAQIVYVMRDGSGIEVEDVDLDLGYELFKASMDIYRLNKQVDRS